MSNVSKKYRNPKKVAAIELFGLNPDITTKEVAEKLETSSRTVSFWRSDPNFLEACYDRYMMEFGTFLPSVLTSMIREAQAGNVQAARLVLEHSGKLVKNINVTIDSPFEKFLKSVPEAEIVPDGEIVDAVSSIDIIDAELPPRKEESQKLRTRNENIANIKAIERDRKKREYNDKQKEWYKWRKRAKAVNVAPLKGRRPTPAQRKDWEYSIIEAEKSADSK